MTTDFLIMDGGTIVQFWTVSDFAKDWWQDNVQDGPTLGRSHIVEHRCARVIIEDLTEAGFVVKGI